MTRLETPSIADGYQISRRSFETQNRGAEIRHRVERRNGQLAEALNEQTLKALTEQNHIPSKDLRRWRKEAQIPEDAFNEYLEKQDKSCREITNAGVSRAGKTSTKNSLSVAESVAVKLSFWTTTRLLRALSRKQNAGSAAEIAKAKNLLYQVADLLRLCADTL